MFKTKATQCMAAIESAKKRVLAENNAAVKFFSHKVSLEKDYDDYLMQKAVG